MVKFVFKPGTNWACWRRIRTQIEWNVATHMRSATGPTNCPTRSFISAAALLVKVIADWLAVDVVDLAARNLISIICLSDDQVREEAEVLCRATCLTSCLGNRQAGVERLPGCQDIGAGFDNI